MPMFMEPQCVHGTWLVTDDDVIPEGYVTDLNDALSGEYVTGWCARLSAPGYMDRTDWVGPFDTAVEAAEELGRMYRSEFDEDEDEHEAWELFLAEAHEYLPEDSRV